MGFLRSQPLATLALLAAGLYQTRAMSTAWNATGATGDSDLSGRGYDTSIFTDLSRRQLDFSPVEARSDNGTFSLAQRDVYNPTIISPHSGTVWVVGTKVKVTWDTSDRPEHVTNGRGTVLLGHMEDGENEHLDVAHPLAHGFDIMQGSVDVTVPNVSPGNEYIIVLMGDSGNKSPTFTIN